MEPLKLIYFEGCPNYKPAVELLTTCGAEYKEIRQDDLKANDPLKNYSSPTLLRGNEIIFGSLAMGGGCSMGLPSKEELNAKLRSNSV